MEPLRLVTAARASLLFSALLLVLSAQRAQSQGAPEELQLRLTGGFYPFNGTLEIYHKGKWGLVCAAYFGDVELKVACTALGYPGASSSYISTATRGSTTKIWLDWISCPSRQTPLVDCYFSNWGEAFACDASEVVGVMCDDTQGGGSDAAQPPSSDGGGGGGGGGGGLEGPPPSYGGGGSYYDDPPPPPPSPRPPSPRKRPPPPPSASLCSASSSSAPSPAAALTPTAAPLATTTTPVTPTTAPASS
ncbi:hypothetical protein HXX76_010313 [Chlamydomonas incerta]|uniref:SRCR domain-containing protein n=1 Tax=Chlamydomonas incerta TaxID=51695 RepID=A0A835VYF2_CHLIN|nr:hypothetical protein HXX76_010313 [Chlamydomonas incerta]|eukprot:KAG2430214.1 hypothetical protein HXX76_010313 [Chlamydomonas incerta]